MKRWLIQLPSKDKENRQEASGDSGEALMPLTNNPASNCDTAPTGEISCPAGGDRGGGKTTQQLPAQQPSSKKKSQNKRKKRQPDPSAQRKRVYREDYIKYGFTWNNKEQQPQCVLCCYLLALESMKPVKMLRHLTTIHPEHQDKPVDFFSRQEKALLGAKKTITTQTSIPAKAQMASYEIAYLIAQQKKGTHNWGNPY